MNMGYDFVTRDPTLTEQRRLFWMRKLNTIYREYSKDVQAVIKLNPDLKSFIADIKSASVQTDLKGGVLAKDLVEEAYKSGVLRADVISGSLGSAADLGVLGFTPANIEAIEILTERTLDGIVGMTAELEKKFKFVMTDGMLKGKGATSLAKDVAKITRDDLWKAKRIVRTEYVNAHNQAAFQRYQDYGFKYYGISVEECDPECEICPPHIGRVYKFGQGPIPPLHPNCRCSIFPIMKE